MFVSHCPLYSKQRMLPADHYLGMGVCLGDPALAVKLSHLLWAPGCSLPSCFPLRLQLLAQDLEGRVWKCVGAFLLVMMTARHASIRARGPEAAQHPVALGGACTMKNCPAPNADSAHVEKHHVIPFRHGAVQEGLTPLSETF